MVSCKFAGNPPLRSMISPMNLFILGVQLFFAKAMDGQHVAQCFQAGAFLFSLIDHAVS